MKYTTMEEPSVYSDLFWEVGTPLPSTILGGILVFLGAIFIGLTILLFIFDCIRHPGYTFHRTNT